MFRPRRPIARMAAGAATAGVAYHAGKAHEQQQAVNQQAQEAYAATHAQQAAPPQYAPPPPQSMPPAPQPLPAGGADDSMAQLEKLAEMHGAGTLTDDEFAAAKAKLLGL
jgi:hypothetical protein